MHRAGVERVDRATDAQEAGRLLEGLVAEARHLEQVLARLEGAVFVAVGDDVGGVAAVQAGDVAEQLLAGGVDLDADAVHRADDDVVEAALELVLIDVVLVLADTDRLRIELHQFGERVHEAAADGDRAAHGDVVVGELLARDLAGAVDRGAAFVDHEHRDRLGQADAVDEGFGFTAGRAVADGDGLDFVAFDQVAQQGLRVHQAVALAKQVDDVVEQQLALGVEHDDLAAGAEAGVDAEHALLAERRRQQQLAQVVGKDAHRLGVGLLLRLQTRLGLHARREQALVAVGRRQLHLRRAGIAAADKEVLQNLNGGLFRRLDAHEQEALLFPASDGEHAVAGDRLERLAPVEVIAELLGVGLAVLAEHDLGHHRALLGEELAQPGARLGVVADALGEDVARAGQGVGSVLDAQLLVLVVRVDELGGLAVEVDPRDGEVRLDEIGQRLQALFLGDGGTRAPLRPERREDVLQAVERLGLVDLRAQDIGHQLALLERLDDGGAAVVEGDQLLHALLDVLDLHLVERAGGLLAVAGDEGDGGAVGEEFGGGADLDGAQAELLGDAFDVGDVEIEFVGGGHAGKQGLGWARPDAQGWVSCPSKQAPRRQPSRARRAKLLSTLAA